MSNPDKAERIGGRSDAINPATAPRPKNHPLTRLFVILAIISGILLVVLLARGPIRTGLTVGYAELFYSGKVDAAHHKSFDPISDKLRGHGIDLTAGSQYAADDGKPKPTDCRLFRAEGLAASVTCDRYSQTAVALSPEFIHQWKNTSKSLEDYLLGQGWQKTWDQHQPIDKLFDNRGNDYSVGVNYLKQYGETTCGLSLMRHGSTALLPDDLYVTTECYRTIKFFGAE